MIQEKRNLTGEQPCRLLTPAESGGCFAETPGQDTLRGSQVRHTELFGTPQHVVLWLDGSMYSKADTGV